MEINSENYWDATERNADLEAWLGDTPIGQTAEQSAADQRSDDWLNVINNSLTIDCVFVETEQRYQDQINEVMSCFVLTPKQEVAA